MDDAQDPYGLEEDAMGENVRFGNDETEMGEDFKILPQILQPP